MAGDEGKNRRRGQIRVDGVGQFCDHLRQRGKDALDHRRRQVRSPLVVAVQRPANHRAREDCVFEEDAHQPVDESVETLAGRLIPKQDVARGRRPGGEDMLQRGEDQRVLVLEVVVQAGGLDRDRRRHVAHRDAVVAALCVQSGGRRENRLARAHARRHHSPPARELAPSSAWTGDVRLDPNEACLPNVR